MNPKHHILILLLCSFTLLTGLGLQQDDPYLFTVKPGDIQGQTQHNSQLYVGYDMGELGGQIEVYDLDGRWRKTIGPLAIGHVSEMDFAPWNGYLYVSDSTHEYKTLVYELDISGDTPRILRTLRNPEWGYYGAIAIDEPNRRMLLHTNEAVPGEITFAYCNMDGQALYDFKLPWIHVPQGIELSGDSIYYYLNTKLEIICAYNGCRKKTHKIPYAGENEGLSLSDSGEVYIGIKAPNRIYNIGRVDEGECPCLSAQPGWNKWNGKWYYYDSNLRMQKGWFKERNAAGTSSVWYMLDEYSGAMQTGWKEESSRTGTGSNWYYLRSSGAMATGWQKVGRSWYYLHSNGVMATGWQKLGSGAGAKWYYLQSNGAMATGWQQIDWKGSKNRYYFAPNGTMRKGWQKTGAKWYYLKPSGAMAASERLLINGARHDFGSNGVWLGQV